MTQKLAVLSAGGEPAEISAIAQALATVLGLPLQAAARQARNGWGVLAENLDPATADRLVVELAKLGAAAQAVPERHLADPPKFFEIPAIEIRPDALMLALPSGGHRSVPWDTVIGVAAAAIPATPEADGPEKIESAWIFFVDVLIGRLTTTRVRLYGKSLDYGFLKGLEQAGAFANFRLLVSDLAGQAPQAIQNRGAWLIVRNRSIAQAGYRSLNDVDQELRWLIGVALARAA